MISKGYGKAQSLAQLDGQNTDRTNRSINSKFSRFSRLSSGLTSRSSTNYLTNNFGSGLRRKDSSKNEYSGYSNNNGPIDTNFNIRNENDQILKSFKRKNTQEYTKGTDNPSRGINKNTKIRDYLKQKIRNYDTDQHLESSKNYDLQEIDSQSDDYFRHKFDTYSEYEKIKKTRLLSKDKKFLSSIKSNKSNKGVKINNFLKTSPKKVKKSLGIGSMNKNRFYDSIDNRKYSDKNNFKRGRLTKGKI